jgi:hypothetical protein
VPISIALWFCIPIGFLFYFEARWLIRYALGRFEKRERRAARLFGVLGASLIPLTYCSGLIADAFPGRLGKTVASGFFALAVMGQFSPMLVTLNERK